MLKQLDTLIGFAVVVLVVSLLNVFPGGVKAAADVGTNGNRSSLTQEEVKAASPTIENPLPDSGDSGSGVHRFRVLSGFEFWLTVVILLFGAMVLGVECYLLRGSQHTSEDILKVCAVTLIVIGTLFAVSAGFSSEQIAPAMGLFGTIAGYLLGRRSSEERLPSNRTDEPRAM